MQIFEITQSIKKYKSSIFPKETFTDYERGYYNGLEVTAAMIENRPAFLLNKHNKFNQTDIDNYPEFFL